jgi:hypothetical protein
MILTNNHTMNIQLSTLADHESSRGNASQLMRDRYRNAITCMLQRSLCRYHHCLILVVVVLAGMVPLVSCSAEKLPPGEAVEQISLPGMKDMPDLPQPFGLLDWKQLALDLDGYLFDFSLEGDYLPLIWIDNNRRNFDQEAFGIYTVVGDQRQGPGRHNGEYHEALSSMGAVLGGSLAGVDKSNQNGYDFPKMVLNYFNKQDGRNVFYNFTRQIGNDPNNYENSFWYILMPNILFYSIADLYPQTPHFDEVARIVADRFFEAGSIINGDYNLRSFNFRTNEPYVPEKGQQPDAAGGIGWLQYMAYQRFGDSKYLEGAQAAIGALNEQTVSGMWECILPFGCYTAARMNAEQGTDYDVEKMLNWVFEGSAYREAGVLSSQKKGGYDLSGAMGHSKIFPGGTFIAMLPMVPLARYDQRFATAIGKWMLNATNTLRFFYPSQLPENQQTAWHLREYSKNVIAYENICISTKNGLKGFDDVPFFAAGDAHNWARNQEFEFHQVNHFSIYGSVHAGILGSIVSPTNVEKILQLDLLATDFYRQDAYPTYLYFNPYDTRKHVEVSLGETPCDIYDTVNKTFVAKNAIGTASFSIDPKSPRVLVFLPPDSKMSIEGRTLFANGIPIDYRYKD